MAAILNSDILNLAILDSAILVFPLKLTLTCQDWFSPFAQKKLHSFSLTQLDDGSQLKFCHVGFIHFAKKKNFNLSFSFNLMMAAILNSAILASAILHKKISLIHFDSTWWWQPSWIPLSWIWPWWNQPFCTKLTQTYLIWLKLIHSHSNWWLQPSWILPYWIQTLSSWIQTPCYLLSESLKNTLTPLWLWFILIQSDSSSFILT